MSLAEEVYEWKRKKMRDIDEYHEGSKGRGD
jgi:hypothetical protein